MQHWVEMGYIVPLKFQIIQSTTTIYHFFPITIFFTNVNKKSLKNDFLTLPALCISESCIKIKIILNFYFHTFLWCLKMFYEAFIKPFVAPKRSVKIKIWVNFFSSSGIGTERVKIILMKPNKKANQSQISRDVNHGEDCSYWP